jgi:hypothetical protein
MLASSRAERSDWIRHCEERSDEATGCFLHSLSLGEGAGGRSRSWKVRSRELESENGERERRAENSIVKYFYDCTITI